MAAARMLPVFLALILMASALAAPPAVSLAQQGLADRSITQVVKLLQDLLEKSKGEGDKERALYGKYKCYCDTNQASKTEEIEQLKQNIGLLGSNIEELQASSAKLSKEVAKLDKDKADNEASRKEAGELRTTEKETFDATEADLVQAIDQMRQAIRVLAEVGADQSMSSAADHAQYMAGHDAALVAMKNTVKKAMLAALAFASEKQALSMNAFVQSPFTGTYSAQSGEVVGILKDMRDTFSANLKSSREAEFKAVAAHMKYMESMQQAYDEMSESYQLKQGELGSNDGILADKKTQLADAEAQLAEAEEFLASLLEMCAQKKNQYDSRVSLRASEQSAISECIAILNSDAAFATFGKVAATSTGAVSFVQRASVHRHGALASIRAHADEASPRAKAMVFLQRADGAKHSPVIVKVLAMLQAGNPFEIVLTEIKKMITLISAEEERDDNQKAWCDSERDKTNTDIGVKTNQIAALKTEIDELVAAIEDPETGLKVSITNSEVSLKQNYENQLSETKDRTEDNLEYQGNIANLVEAQGLLGRAVVVMTKYYDKIRAEIKAGLIQTKDQPAPPETWEDDFKGQSEGGNSAISMLEFILSESKKEEQLAHKTENESQHGFEDSMASLKSEEASLQESLAALKLDLAGKEKTLIEKKRDHEKTEEEKAALEAYLEQIKPGCDFITTNIDHRKGSRVEEKAALEKAVTFLTATPVYKDAMESAHQESLGICKDTCNKSDDHVDCKSCLAGVSVPGYCAGHPSTAGC